jgi:parallel beta-helix repeat protein
MVIAYGGIGGTLRSFIVLAALIVAGAFNARAVSAAEACGGDCNLNGLVAVNELVTGVNISLDPGKLAACKAMDTNNSLEVEVNELVAGVNHSLQGCPPIACVAPVDGRCVEITPGPGVQDKLLTALVEAQPKDVIFIRTGRYELDMPLAVEANDVTIQGEGPYRSVLSFRNQTNGAQSLFVQGDHFTLQDVGFEDGPGDMVKILGSDGVTMRGVRTEWTGGPSTENGSYGLYPVECRGVLIEDCIVKGASDAGVYVGQSRNIVVRRNQVEFNVAGVEIENSTDADVYNNTATKNTGGILVFNLPGPPVQDGRRTRVHDNEIYENNTENFGAPGSSVSIVPTGTGSLILSNDDVEIFNNAYRDNDTSHIIMISYTTAVLFGAEQPNNPDFDPYSEGVFIHDNTFVGGGTNPPSPSFDVLVNLNGGLPLPSIIFDGEFNKAKLVDGMLPDDERTCVQQPDATFINFDLGSASPVVSKDLLRSTARTTHCRRSCSARDATSRSIQAPLRRMKFSRRCSRRCPATTS